MLQNQGALRATRWKAGDMARQETNRQELRERNDMHVFRDQIVCYCIPCAAHCVILQKRTLIEKLSIPNHPQEEAASQDRKPSRYRSRSLVFSPVLGEDNDWAVRDERKCTRHCCIEQSGLAHVAGGVVAR